jgi:hypothetical protein
MESIINDILKIANAQTDAITTKEIHKLMSNCATVTAAVNKYKPCDTFGRRPQKDNESIIQDLGADKLQTITSSLQNSGLQKQWRKGPPQAFDEGWSFSCCSSVHTRLQIAPSNSRSHLL